MTETISVKPLNDETLNQLVNDIRDIYNKCEIIYNIHNLKSGNKVMNLMDDSTSKDILDISPPNKFNLKSFIFQQSPKLKFLNNSEILNYFETLVGIKEKQSKRIIITNLDIYVSLMFFGGIYVYRTSLPKICTFCNCIARQGIIIDCSHCTNNKRDIMCGNCYTKYGGVQCSNNFEHAISIYNAATIPYLAIKCDICQNSQDVYKETISSRTHEVDLCKECSMTQKGIELLNKYDMKPYPNINKSMNYQIGSIFDWIPIYSDNDNNYIVVCLNEENEMYHYLGIVHKNIHNEYEYTIVDKKICVNSLEDIHRLNISDNLCIVARKIYENVAQIHDYMLTKIIESGTNSHIIYKSRCAINNE